MNKFESGSHEQDNAFTAPSHPSKFKKVARAAALFAAGWGAQEGLMPEQALAAEQNKKNHISQNEKHKAPKTELEKVKEARIKQINTWLKDFKIKTLAVQYPPGEEEVDIQPGPPGEQLELWNRGVKQGILDSRGYIKILSSWYNIKDQNHTNALKYNESLLKGDVGSYLLEHTDYNIVSKAKPDAASDGNHKNKIETHAASSEKIAGIQAEYFGNAKAIMEKTGVAIVKGAILLRNNEQINLSPAGQGEKVEKLTIKAKGEKNVLITCHYHRGGDVTYEVVDGEKGSRTIGKNN